MKDRGFTFIELMVVLFMLSFVMMAVYSLYLTHQRSAYTQEEVVEVQQNLRIGMESMTRDIRMAGFLSSLPAVNAYAVSQGPALSSVYPYQQVAGTSDSITLTTATATGKIARIAQQPAIGSSVYIIDDPSSVKAFASTDTVSIIRPGNRIFPDSNTNVPLFNNYTLSALNSTVPSITLSTAPAGIYIAGDLIIDTEGFYPNTIQYCLGPAAGCGSTVTTCPTGQLCLMRIVNGVANPIAQNMANLKLSYLMDGGAPETTTPAPNYTSIRAVKVTLFGQTMTTNALSGTNTAHQRRLDAVIDIRDR